MARLTTRVLPITAINPPHVDAETNLLDWFKASRDTLSQDQVNHLLEAAQSLQTSSVPVAFPTETVYGLGADATRSEAVRGIYTAKQRPSDNPLIVHVGCLDQLRRLLRPPREMRSTNGSSQANNDINGTTTTSSSSSSSSRKISEEDDPIPAIYRPLIHTFWPGPLTLLFPLPSPSPLAPEVTPSLNTVGIRMPSSPLARLLISLSDRPLAAPSANASTRPSPTTAAHVLQDLDGRVEIILDGGGCAVGVESTVVDGVVRGAPVVLRPGGVGIEEIRGLGGVWSAVAVGYEDREQMRRNGDIEVNGSGSGSGSGGRSASENGNHAQHAINGELHAPRAPGMKYRHYAPRARVHLFEDRGPSSSSSSSEDAARDKMLEYCHRPPTTSPPAHKPLTNSLKIGVIATKTWRNGLGFPALSPSSSSSASSSSSSSSSSHPSSAHPGSTDLPIPNSNGASASNTPDHPTPELPRSTSHHTPTSTTTSTPHDPAPEIYSVQLGPTVEEVARGLFGALRELDGKGCDVILVEGIGESEGELAAAVMNRLRKAAAG